MPPFKHGHMYDGSLYTNTLHFSNIKYIYFWDAHIKVKILNITCAGDVEYS